MNLKNKYLLKKLLKWTNIKCKNFTYNVAFKKKRRKTPGDIMIQISMISSSSWDTEQNKLKLVILGHFLPFHPPKKPPKIKVFNKMKKVADISSFYKCAPKIKIICCTIPEIRSKAGKSFCHFGPFFALLPTNDPENQNFEKIKKMPRDIILLYIHMYHKWRSYDTWFLKYKAQQTKFLVILGHFCPFTHLTTTKIKILKKMKKQKKQKKNKEKSLEILWFYKYVP